MTKDPAERNTHVKQAIHSRTLSDVLALALTLLPIVIVLGQNTTASTGFDPIAYIHGEIDAGSKTISVPCDRYWLTPAEDSTCYLALKGLSDVTIDFNGGELIGKIKTSMLDLEGCTNVTLRDHPDAHDITLVNVADVKQ